MKEREDFTSWRYVLRESFAGFCIAMGIVLMVFGGLMLALTWAYG